jgi:hypothetical protein
LRYSRYGRYFPAGGQVGQTIVLCRLPPGRPQKAMACPTYAVCRPAGHKKRWPAPLASSATRQATKNDGLPHLCRLPPGRPQKTMACPTGPLASSATRQATKNDGLPHLCHLPPGRPQKRWPAPLMSCAVRQATKKNDGLPHLCRVPFGRPQKTMACPTFQRPRRFHRLVIARNCANRPEKPQIFEAHPFAWRVLAPGVAAAIIP